MTGSYTYLDVTSLGWGIASGNKYAVALWSDAANWNNPDGSAGGLAWNGGVSSADNTTVFNNWAVPDASWEDWGNATTGFSLGLSTQAVPEPATCAMALVGLACGGYSLFRRRHAR
ncbi:MAG: PEP-CTERM sorting domain-containing protein [Planctomycetaceae bacterium]